MKTRYFLPLAAIVLLAGCNKEVAVEEVIVPKTVLEVNIGPATKTSLGAKEGNEYKVYWSNGDQIAVNGSVSDGLQGIDENAQSASFSFNDVLTAPYNILYPASIYSDATHVTLPAVQTYKAGGFGEGMFPMAGYSADGSGITLSHLCAIVKISVKRATANADTDNIVAVRFKGRNSEKVNGSFEIAYNPAALTPATGSGSELEVRVVKSQATSTTTPVDYYLVVPARTYSSGFDIIVQDANGHIMTKSKETSKELVAGHLYAMSAFEFVPTGTELGIEIASAQDLIDFATAYNNKEYVDKGSSLLATLTNDISFTAAESDAFNATKGIGLKTSYYGDAEDYYFDGTFKSADNQNYTISGLSATVPLFKATSSSAVIKDFTVDNTCSFTFTHSNAAELDAGSVVGYHRGTLDNVTVNANVSLTAVDEVNKVTALGGLVGREVVGTVKDCSCGSAITVPDGFKTSAQKIYIGGLVGFISNADGKVKDSAFSGTIDNQGQMVAESETDDFKANPQLMIGGIIGFNTGTIDNCTVANHATGITVTLTDDKGDHPYTGSIATHSTNAYHYAIAGVAGRNDGTVQNCTNNAAILNVFSAARGTSGNMNGRYLEVGGIVGFNASGKTVSGCTNNGAIITRANPKVQYVGGIVAWNYGTVSSCANESSASIAMGTSHTSPYGARMSYVGGVIGHNRSSATVSDIQNAANIVVSRVETTTGVTHRIGGVIGQSDAVIDGENGGGTINNSGDVSQSNGVGMCDTPTATNDYGYSIGGIVGYATKAVKNVSNSGAVSYTCSATGVGAQYVYVGGVIGKVNAASAVDVEHCSNTANVTYSASAKYSDNNATRYYYNYVGGIVGYAKNASIKGDSSSHCTNSGIIKGGDGSSNNNTNGNNIIPSFIVGGIVGYITGDSSIEYCELTGTGQSYNDHWSNRGIGNYDCPMNGGIVGYAVGADGEPIVISNCSVSSTSGTDGNTAVYSRRGAVGGIAGMAQYATISNCSVPVNYSGSGYFYGGIVAQVKNSTISSCTYSGTTIQSSQIQIGGGIVGKLDAGGIVDGCNSYATTINKNGTAITAIGGISGSSVAGSTIQNNHYKSGLNICSDGNFSGSNNVADL